MPKIDDVLVDLGHFIFEKYFEDLLLKFRRPALDIRKASDLKGKYVSFFTNGGKLILQEQINEYNATEWKKTILDSLKYVFEL